MPTFVPIHQTKASKSIQNGIRRKTHLCTTFLKSVFLNHSLKYVFKQIDSVFLCHVICQLYYDLMLLIFSKILMLLQSRVHIFYYYVHVSDYSFIVGKSLSPSVKFTCVKFCNGRVEGASLHPHYLHSLSQIDGSLVNVS